MWVIVNEGSLALLKGHWAQVYPSTLEFKENPQRVPRFKTIFNEILKAIQIKVKDLKWFRYHFTILRHKIVGMISQQQLLNQLDIQELI